MQVILADDNVNLTDEEIEQLFKNKTKNILFSFEDEMAILEKEILEKKKQIS
ncbi:MAG: hypothetical protein NTW35_02555 [Candidatus Nomurabacteria bacterium]|nr:hypothetical protein [Candidatus Nomurabacteria bacterium]